MKIFSTVMGFEASIQKNCHHLSPVVQVHMLVMGSLLNSFSLVLAIPVFALVARLIYVIFLKNQSDDRLSLLYQLKSLE